MGYVFISYSSINRKSADKMRSIFKRNGIDSWIAPDDIPVGSEYAGVINKAIKNCACFVLLLTGDSMRSQWVAKEVERAINYKKPVIPVQLEDICLTDQFELYISTNQVLTLSEVDEATPEMQRLIAVVQKYVAASGYEKATLEAEILRDPQLVDDMPFLESARNKKRKLSPALIAVLGGILAIVVLAALIPGLSGKTDGSTNIPDTTPTGSQSPTAGQTPEDTQGSSAGENTTPVSGTNEIPSVYESQVTELQEASELALRNSTIRVKVGQSVQPPATFVWKEATIYSQDTGIAVGDGLAVAGVSKGETYVVVEAALGIAQVYYVIVE